ncbi:MAG TPA: hypothetical protein VFG50_17155 [Rhodothermales bacterium]|nr:hypothetical protein [Rhodothermales bacterium]
MRSPLLFRGRNASVFVTLLLVLWFLAAAALGATGMLGVIPTAFISGSMWALLFAALASVWHVHPLYAWMERLHLRAFVLPHASRILGVTVAAVYLPRLLPHELALSAAAAEVLVGVAALALCVSGLPIRRDWQWRAMIVWNACGLAGLLTVIGVAVHTMLAHPASVAALSRFPGCLLPTFLLPLLIASHVLLFDRLRKRAVAYGG